jgi:hypothetical protein
MNERLQTHKEDTSNKKMSRNNRINLRIDDNELSILNSISFEDDESISQIVRKAIKQYDALRKNRKMF